VLDENIHLVIEKERPEAIDTDEDMSEQEIPKETRPTLTTQKPSLLQQAFLSTEELPTKTVVIVQDGHNSTTVVESTPVTTPVFGAALKSATSDKASKRKLKIDKKKAERAKLLLKKQTESSESESESSEAEKAEITKEDAVWKSNVIEGEKLPGLERNYVPKPKESPTEPVVDKPIPPRHPAFYVPVNRLEQYQLSRVALPVVAEEAPIMEAILENDVIVLCGETGSGKTTQVPQFLYEAGFGDPKHPKFKGMVGITQPRRVAAISMAQRVSQELNVHQGEVAYQVRYDASTVNSNTRIKFMTDGILLRELSSAASKGDNHQGGTDLLLTKYSCIIVDEAHERTVGTDVLIGWLTRILTLRNSGSIKGLSPLKLVIMSATLRVEDFTENKQLFPLTKPPVLKVDGRQYKVLLLT
jgi:ATP-dependent RNA helicase DHX37/DHR1